MVNKMTGIAPSVAIHIPWDKPEDNDYAAMNAYAEAQGIPIGAVNPNVFQDDEYKLGSLGNPDAGHSGAGARPYARMLRNHGRRSTATS